MEWPLRKESLDSFWKNLAAHAEPAASRARFPRLSRPRVHVAVLAALALILCVGGLAAHKTLEGDEALYSLIPKTIVMTGDWFHLTYNGEPYFFKPPLNFWISAAIFHVLPMTAFSAALGSALFGALSALMIYAVCRAMFPGWELAFASALVFLTTHEVLHWTRGVHLESMVTFWILVGLWAAYRSVKNPAAIAGLGVAAGLGWLAKGPQSLYPAFVAVLLWTSERILGRRLFSLWSVVAGVVLIAILAPWFLLRLGEGSGFGHGYFIKEIGHTLFGPTQLHNGPLFYPVKIAATYWPWLPVAAGGFIILARGWRDSVGARLWLFYGALVAVIIMVTAERRMRYLYQLYPALSVAAGVAVTFAAQRWPRMLRIFIVMAAIGAAGLLAFGRRSTPPSPPTRDAVVVAGRIRPDEQVWLTERTQHGAKVEPSIAKSLGFYAPPLLRSCQSDCSGEAAAGSTVIARSDEAQQVAQVVNGKIDYANKTLAIVKIPGAGR
ncbi:MAG TPA: glycosyltransferase family 39 protein [Candidatus Binatia bacterium]